jgi:hypothetical protein
MPTITLQNRLLKTLDSLIEENVAPQRLKKYVNQIKDSRIPNNDYVNVLTFIKILISEIPSADSKELHKLFLFSKDKISAEEKHHTKPRSSKRR